MQLLKGASVLFLILVGIYVPTVLLITGIVCLTGVCGSDPIFPYWFVAISSVILFSTLCFFAFAICRWHVYFCSKLRDLLPSASSQGDDLNYDLTMI